MGGPTTLQRCNCSSRCKEQLQIRQSKEVNLWKTIRILDYLYGMILDDLYDKIGMISMDIYGKKGESANHKMGILDDLYGHIWKHHTMEVLVRCRNHRTRN